MSHLKNTDDKKWSDEIVLEIFITQPTEWEILNGDMGITLKTYQTRLRITPGKNHIRNSHIVPIHQDCDSIMKNNIHDRAFLPTAPQTIIRIIAHGVSMEHLLPALTLNNRNFEEKQCYL